MNAIVYTVGAMILRRLSGFRGYPKAGPGEDAFIHALCGCSLSVAHANAIVDTFNETFPTLREIRDAALNIRPRFEFKAPEKELWEKQYGKPDPNWSKKLTGSYEQQKAKVFWQSIRDTIYYTEGPGRGKDTEFWTGQALRMRRDHPEELAAFRRDELSRGWEDLMKEDWINEAPMPVEAPKDFKRITQADIDRVKAQRPVVVEEREPGEGE